MSVLFFSLGNHAPPSADGSSRSTEVCTPGPLQVAIGCDPRVSGPLLVPAALAGLQAAGAVAVDVGLSTTPAMFYGLIAPGGSIGASSSWYTGSSSPYNWLLLT